MPMVRSGAENRLDLGVVEQAAVVRRRHRARARHPQRQLNVGRVDIADPDKLAPLGKAVERAHDAAAAASRPDHRHLQPLVGAAYSRVGLRRPEAGRSQSRSGRPEKPSSPDIVCHLQPPQGPALIRPSAPAPSASPCHVSSSLATNVDDARRGDARPR